jgi:GNAT superfamily N-acetyltransferase
MHKLITAQPIHAKQILPYLTRTCYWKEFADGNTQNKSYEDFMLEWIINPRLSFTTVLVKESKEEIVKGCIITATTNQLAKMPDYSPYLHSRVLETFKDWFTFPVSDSVMIELIFVEKDLRGKGYGSKLYQIAEELAKQEKKDCISGFIWSFFPDSLINATRKGRMVKACIYFPKLIELPLLYIEKKPEYTLLKDYFQSEAYLQVPNVLLA